MRHTAGGHPKRRVYRTAFDLLVRKALIALLRFIHIDNEQLF